MKDPGRGTRRRAAERATLKNPCVRCGVEEAPGRSFMGPACHREVERSADHDRCPFPSCTSVPWTERLGVDSKTFEKINVVSVG